METRGLLFIPDITGFTTFVTEIELAHSKQIIKELLEILIDSNLLRMDISEVEGDAILFYKMGEVPDVGQIYEQVEKMFCAFHEQIIFFSSNCSCDCRACASVTYLTLKIITHHGEFTLYDVKNFRKLIGKDVIIAHRLLKNDVPGGEYWLITKSLFKEDSPGNYRHWMKWETSVKETDHGEIHFHFTSLSKLKQGQR